MVYHVMADGTRRDNIDGYIIPREISESVLITIKKRCNSVKEGTIKKK